MNEVKNAVPIIPTIPREVAEAIERLRKVGWSDRYLVDITQYDGIDTFTPVCLCLRYFREYPVAYVSAIINGYTVEKSAEESAEAAQERLLSLYVIASSLDKYGEGYRYGVTDTLEALGVTIAGINDNKSEVSV